MRSKLLNSQTQRNLTVLLVGEHQVILQAMKCWLGPLGHQLTWVNNGLEALRQLRQRHFDLVVTVLDTPGLDGSLIADFLRNTNNQATIVRLSAEWYHEQTCVLMPTGTTDRAGVG